MCKHAWLLLAMAPCIYAGTIGGLGYSPFTASYEFCLSDAQVIADLGLIMTLTSRVRLYGLACGNSHTILEFANSNKLMVQLGVWLNSDAASNEREMASLAQLLAAWGSYGTNLISAVAVGNEYISINGGNLPALLSYLDSARHLALPYRIPVTYVDIPAVWQGTWPGMTSTVAAPSLVPAPAMPGSTTTGCKKGLPESVCSLLQRVEFVGCNIHPFFEGLPASCAGLNITNCTDGPTWAVNRAKSLSVLLGKQVVVTEIGWPSEGETCCNHAPAGFPTSAQMLAVPSVSASMQHLARFSQLADQAGLSYFYFEAFNADWKRVHATCVCVGFLNTVLSGCAVPETGGPGLCQYEYHWGLLDGNRLPKPGMNLSDYLLPGAPVNLWTTAPPSTPLYGSKASTHRLNTAVVAALVVGLLLWLA